MATLKLKRPMENWRRHVEPAGWMWSASRQARTNRIRLGMGARRSVAETEYAGHVWDVRPGREPEAVAVYVVVA